VSPLVVIRNNPKTVDPMHTGNAHPEILKGLVTYVAARKVMNISPIPEHMRSHPNAALPFITFAPSIPRTNDL
jgi:hypothetical protein